jgi:hypothetical protein
MKTLLLSLLLVLNSLLVTAQNYYKATLTELYTYNNENETWELYQKNSDVNITIVVEEEFINIQAQSPSFYKIVLSTKQPINMTNFVGYRYVVKDFRKDSYIKVDIMNHKTTNTVILSFVDSEGGVNLRYFLTKM